MKKILLLILTLFLFLSCYIIYQMTENETLNYVLVGDDLVNNPYIIKNNNYKNSFVNNDYRIIDLLRNIKYNEELVINDKMVSIHQQLMEADVLVMAIGMNEIYYKLDSSTKNKYAYINKLIYNLKELFKLINKYDYKKIYFIGYYNNNWQHKELFNYLNTSVKRIVKDYNICFVDIEKIANGQGQDNEKSDILELNDDGYKKIYNFIVENLEKC